MAYQLGSNTARAQCQADYNAIYGGKVGFLQVTIVPEADDKYLEARKTLTLKWNHFGRG